MMTSRRIIRYANLALLLLAGCVEPYMPDVVSAPASLLVVDGFINGNGPSTFLLSRSLAVASTAAPPAEKGAQVLIADDAGRTYPLTERAAGTYVSDSLVLDAARRYQLRITTTAKASYASDPVALKITPPIDALGFQHLADQMQLTLSTHDPQQQARYYRWSFVETWQFNSAFESRLEFKDSIIVDRTTPIYTCWRTEQSHAIAQGSSAQLAQDALLDFPLLRLSDHSERFKVRYSVLVSQYAETAEEFAYWELLRKNTEAVGTVNDPLPVELTGNVHRTDKAGEAVLGFVGAHTVQQKRLFIGREELNRPDNNYFENLYATCQLGEELVPAPGDKHPISIPHTRIFSSPSNVPVDYQTNGAGNYIGYVGSTYECVDCRARGSNVKPSFW